MDAKRGSVWLLPLRWLGRLLAMVVFNPLAERLWAGGPVKPKGGAAAPPIQELLDKKARVMWVGAHPDDESFCGSLLAYASLKAGAPMHFVVMTRGDGGGAAIPIPEGKTVADVREGELRKVAELYKATLALNSFHNAPLPVESFPKRQELLEMWKAKEDPVAWIAREIRAFRPDIVLTFSPIYGATGHPEHQLTSRLATAAVRMAADETAALGNAPHRVAHTYYVLMRYWFLRLIGMRFDPIPYTETFEIKQPCVDGLSCFQVMADNTLPHETQRPDMGAMRGLSSLLHRQMLYRVDPWTEIYDPAEPVAKGGMGADLR